MSGNQTEFSYKKADRFRKVSDIAAYATSDANCPPGYGTTMSISSRTPEGQPNRCPLCGNEVCIEPSLPFGDAPCPNCGRLLMFAKLGNVTHWYERSPGDDLQQRVLEILARHFGVPNEQLAAHPAWQTWDATDSLDIVEAVMELEEEFGGGDGG